MLQHGRCPPGSRSGAQEAQESMKESERPSEKAEVSRAGPRARTLLAEQSDVGNGFAPACHVCQARRPRRRHNTAGPSPEPCPNPSASIGLACRATAATQETGGKRFVTLFGQQKAASHSGIERSLWCFQEVPCLALS